MRLRTVLWVTAAQTALFALGGWLLWLAAGPHEESMITAAPWEIALGLALAGGLIASGLVLIRLFPAYGEWLIRAQARSYPFLKDRLPLSAIIALSICAGLGEELLFRGGLQTLLASALPAPFGTPLAIALASAVFAAIHLARPLVTLLILLIGALFGVAYWWSGSLFAVIVGHAVYDVWALRFLQEGMHRLGVFGETPASTP